ncbi:MAG: Holliday junction resolvase RuvX [Amylibacter sp.]|jgi:putative Holliday junction resolvase|tara:strand:- start:3365 stop:3835 length:471 start_codon:yes stop_codon:yes gene_type:complete
MSYYDDFITFAGSIPKFKSLLGLDLGTKTIGIAVSDTLWSIATPRETIKRKKFGLDADALEVIIKNTNAGGIVLGLPMNMDGSEGPRCQATRAFARNLAARCDLPIGFWDERLSSIAAERAMLEADMSRAKRANAIDHVAASYILQGALDRIGNLA